MIITVGIIFCFYTPLCTKDGRYVYLILCFPTTMHQRVLFDFVFLAVFYQLIYSNTKMAKNVFLDGGAATKIHKSLSVTAFFHRSLLLASQMMSYLTCDLQYPFRLPIFANWTCNPYLNIDKDYLHQLKVKSGIFS